MFSAHKALPNLTTLHLSGNSFHGPIDNGDDPFIVSPRLQYVSLTNNRLTGVIPKALQQHSFAYLDLSQNRLRGSVEDMGGTCVCTVIK